MFIIQKRQPGRKWITVSTGLTREDAAQAIAGLRKGQEGVSEWDAISYRMGMDR